MDNLRAERTNGLQKPNKKKNRLNIVHRIGRDAITKLIYRLMNYYDEFSFHKNAQFIDRIGEHLFCVRLMRRKRHRLDLKMVARSKQVNRELNTIKFKSKFNVKINCECEEVAHGPHTRSHQNYALLLLLLLLLLFHISLPCICFVSSFLHTFFVQMNCHTIDMFEHITNATTSTNNNSHLCRMNTFLNLNEWWPRS